MSHQDVVDLEELLERRPELEAGLPDKPEEPSPRDCCGQSCNPCVFDIYRDELALWARTCKGMIRQGSKSTGDSSTELDLQFYRKFCIHSIICLTHDTNLYRLELNHQNASLNMLPGQHLIVQGVRVNGRTIARPLTPVSFSNAIGFFDLLIKIYEDGKLSSVVKNWQVGDYVQCRGPFGNFAYTENMWSELVMFAAGTGIAPMAQIIDHVLANDRDNTRMRLIVCVRQARDVLLREDIARWSRFWNFSVVYFFSQDTEYNPKYGETVIKTRLAQEHVQTEVDRIRDHNRVMFLTCGTKAFDKDVLNYLLKSDVPKEQCFKF